MKQTTTRSRFCTTLLTFVCFSLFSFQTIFAQCPSVGNTNVTTCAFDGTNTTTVANLATLATVTGGNPNIEWYNALTGGSVIPITNFLTDGIYYLDTDIAECTPRIAVNVTVDGEGSPSDFIGFAVGRCNGDTLTDAENSFSAPGNILWYAAASGGTPLVESTQVLTTTTYFISYTENGCESQRSSMQYIIIPAQDPIINMPNPICLLPGDILTVGDLDAYITNASGFNISWYDTETDAINETNPLLDTEVVVDGDDYWVVIETSPCPSNPAVLIPNLEVQPQTGTPNPDGPFCETEGQANTLPTNADLTTMLTGIVDAGGVWTEDNGTSELSGGTDTVIDIQNIYNTFGIGSYCFTYTVINGTAPDTCVSATTVCIQIDPILVAGTATAPLVICETNLAANSPTNLFDLLTGEDVGGTWADDTGSCLDLSNPTTVDITCLTPGDYTYTYTVNQTNACPPESETVMITVTEAPELISTNPPPFCIVDTPAGTIDLFTFLTTDSSGGTGVWVDATSTGALTLPSTVDVDVLIAIGAGSYSFNYTVDNGAGCITTTAVVVTIEPIPEPVDATIASICKTDLVAGAFPFTTLDSQLTTGDPATTDWTVIIPTPASVLIDPITGQIDWAAVITNAPNGASTTFTFQATSNASVSCLPEVGTISFTVIDVPAQAPTATHFDVCEIYTLQDLIDDAFPTVNAGTVILIYDSLTGGSPLTPTAVIPVGGPYTYYVTNQDINGCESNPRTEITVTVNANVDAGLAGAINMCITATNSINLFDELNGTPDTGGTWSGPAATTNGDQGTLDLVITPLTSGTQVFTYTVSGLGTCPDATADIFVTIDPLPDGGGDGPLQTLCSTNATIDLFNLLTGTPTSGGTWSPALNSGANIFDPTMDASGIYTYTVSNSCGTAPSSQIEVMINQTPILDILANQEVCDSFTFPTITGTDLTGNEAYYDAVNAGGTQYNAGDTFTPATTGITTFYIYDETATTPNCFAETTFDVTVNFTPALNAINPLDQCDSFTFPAITGTNLSGSEAYYDATNSGGTQYNAGDTFTPTTAGTYTFFIYDQVGTAPNICTNEISFSVNINLTPDAGLDNAAAVTCISDTPFDLTTILGGTSDAGGTWSPALTSGTNIFDPSTDTAGSYIYTVTATAPCTDASATVTITIQNPGTPTVNDQSFCLIDNPTVADLVVNGLGGYVWYDTDTSTTPLNATDPLIDGEEYWVTQNNGCESLPTMMTVTISDPGTPDINIDGNLFCIIDNPTIADLEAEIINLNNYTVVWYDSLTAGNILNITTPLVDGVTYYASFTFIPCESAVRFPIIADLTDCSGYDIIIPDAFSPNDDGQNDTYTINNIDILYPNYTLEIYNRYGNIVYKGNINTDDFNGKPNQSQFLSKEVLPTGVYYYILEFNKGNRKPEQGRLYLSR